MIGICYAVIKIHTHSHTHTHIPYNKCIRKIIGHQVVSYTFNTYKRNDIINNFTLIYEKYNT